MARSVRDLRELICLSRLSYHGEDEVEITKDIDTKTVPKETTTHSKIASHSKVLSPVSPPGTPGSSGRGSPLPPIGKRTSGSSDSSSSSLRSTPPSSPNAPSSNIGCDAGQIRPMSSTRNYKLLKRNFDSLLSYFDATIVADWLTRANNIVSKLSSWVQSGDSFVNFANFWLDEVSPRKRSELIAMEYSIVMDELKFAFGVGLQSNQVTEQDLVIFMNAVLWEYPEKVSPSQSGPFFLNTLMCLCCGRKHNYRQLLSDVKCSTTNKQFVQFILATRAFAIVSLVSGVLDFYKQIHPLKEPSDGASELSLELCQMAEEFAFKAIQKGLVEVFKYFLLNYEFELQEDKGMDRKSFLFATILSGREEMLKFLLKETKYKADINKRSLSSGNTALHAAVNTGNVNIVQILASAGADMNAWNGDCEGATPLHLAILSGNKDMVEMLLSLKCDPTVRMGVPATVTPLMLARDLGLDEVVSVLETFKVN